VDQDTLSEELGVSRQELSARFHYLLTIPPMGDLIASIAPPSCTKPGNPWVYGYDGKWLNRSPILLVHRDVTHHQTLWWSIARSENMTAIQEDLVSIATLIKPTLPAGAVTDGKPGIGEVIKGMFHLSVVQRCVVHVERDLKKYLPLHSPLVATQKLREICIPLTGVKTRGDYNHLYFSLTMWESEYGHLLKERSRPNPGSGVKRTWWYTHGNLRRAWRLLNRDPNSLFHFLDNLIIPSTNNSLEGVNRHLTRRAGMIKGKQLSIMCWKLAFSRLKTPRQRKLLWDKWKRLLNP
jgi:hypothetical protein